jgi:N-acyl-phosphatidylethanolamine-hydrolysing phospholipase D
MRRALPLSLVSLALAALVLAGALVPAAESWSRPPAAHHAARGFHNLDPSYRYPIAGRLGHLVRDRFQKSPARGATPRPLANDGAALRANGHDPTVTLVGHSTLLVQLDGVNLLTDPHWGERASPVGFAGPRRLVPPGVRFEDLPPVHAVVISHDHYDHLDEATVLRLAQQHRPRFFVPLGLRDWLADRGIEDVVEMDWWESAEYRGLTFACTPAQHSSGRGLHDQNLRLWSSWVVLGSRRFYFAGDTGYYAGLREIGQRYGPFDLAAIPIGGYQARARSHPNHLNPEEAVRVFEEVGGRLLVPIHYGTFSMNREPFREPPDRLLAEARRRGVPERVAPLAAGQTVPW